MPNDKIERFARARGFIGASPVQDDTTEPLECRKLRAEYRRLRDAAVALRDAKTLAAIGEAYQSLTAAIVADGWPKQ